jgi:four helix bundle protein
MSNIAEGFERGSNSELNRFLFIAKGSCAEVRSQLYVAFDIGYLGADEFQQLQQQAREVARLIGGLRASLVKQIDP